MKLRNKSETYVRIYNNLRAEQNELVVQLQKEVRELTRMVEFLAKVVFEK
jgi:hypothetical protein